MAFPEHNQQTDGPCEPPSPTEAAAASHAEVRAPASLPAEPEPLLDTDPLAEAEGEGEMEDWKARMRREFDTWLEGLDEIPDPDPEDEEPETPDLYSFYAQWAAANAEARKGNRRTAEVFTQWNDALGKFEHELGRLREQLQRAQEEAPAKGMSRAHCLILVELSDRLQRVARAFASPPAGSWWGGAAGWRRAWASQRQAFDILLGHLDALLKKEGLIRIETLGGTFDASRMAAVAAEPDNSRPDQTVLEELAPGYLLRGELLRPAQVKVSRNQT